MTRSTALSGVRPTARTGARAALALAGAVGLALALSGCGAKVPEKTVEKEVSDKIADTIGFRPKDVDCPGGMPLEEGGKAECTLTVTADRKIGVTIKIAKIEGTTPTYEYDIDASDLLP